MRMNTITQVNLLTILYNYRSLHIRLTFFYLTINHLTFLTINNLMIKIYKTTILNYKPTHYVQTCNLISRPNERTETEDIWEFGANENIWI
jgi:hypothetical protein